MRQRRELSRFLGVVIHWRLVVRRQRVVHVIEVFFEVCLAGKRHSAALMPAIHCGVDNLVV